MTFNKPVREIDRVFLHCSDSDYPQHDDISVIREWHVQGNGWRDVGYHFFIKKDGTIQNGRDLELIPAAQLHNNTGTIAICCSGRNEFTKKQKKSLRRLCNSINRAYSGEISFHGHCEVDLGRTCPVYNYKEWLVLDKSGRIKKFKAI